MGHFDFDPVIGQQAQSEFAAVIGRKSVFLSIHDKIADEAFERGTPERDFRHREEKASPLLPKMVALDPDILLRERRSPILFEIAFAACKITGLGSDCNRSVDGVIHADDAVVAFHVRDVGEETHNGRGERCPFDCLERPQLQDAFYPEIILFKVHTDERFRKDAVADFQHKRTFGCI